MQNFEYNLSLRSILKPIALFVKNVPIISIQVFEIMLTLFKKSE